MFKERGFDGPVHQDFNSRLEHISQLLDSYQIPPFTVQRLAELLADDSGQYTVTHKYMNGLEKVLSVSTSI